MKPTWSRTAHFNQAGQFCSQINIDLKIGGDLVKTDQWVVLEATGLRHEREALGVQLDVL
jgi:hypothetical protein